MVSSALIMIRNDIQEFHKRAKAILDRMNFGVFYGEEKGQLRGGFWEDEPPEGISAACSKTRMARSMAVFFTGHHYATLNSETRIASYIGIARETASCSRITPSCIAPCPIHPKPEMEQEMNPDGVHYTYRGMKIVPSWNGTMFEALMVPLFVPEEEVGSQDLGC